MRLAFPPIFALVEAKASGDVIQVGYRPYRSDRHEVLNGRFGAGGPIRRFAHVEFDLDGLAYEAKEQHES